MTFSLILKSYVTQKQGRQVVKYDKPMFTSLVKKKITLYFPHTPSDIYIFPSSWRGRIILSIIPRILVIVLKGKSKHVSIPELWLSSYKIIKAGMCKKTGMYSLVEISRLNHKDNVLYII